MDPSVISTLAGGAVSLTSAVSLANTPANEGLPGDFAALLFGELQNLLPLGQKQSGQAIAASLDKALERGSTDSQDGALSVVDPATIAALIGNAQMQPAMQTRGMESLTSGVDQTKNAKLSLADEQSGLTGAERAAAKALTGNLPGALEKFALANNPLQGAASTLRSEAANIAAEATTTAAEPNPSSTANSLSSLVSGRQNAEAPRTVQQPNVSTHLHESSWPQQFGEKIVWLAKNDQQSAQININPPQLGPIQITLNLSGDQATLAFASPHAEVRQAIESSLPQLKEMLSSAGINLGQSNVGANLSQRNPDNPFQTANGNRSANENAILPANDKVANGLSNSPALHRGRGLVDLFA
ncbi:MAG: flagellar hook-length control protein FliK [Azonexus sp.]|nr:flagellar hook-length control protein FliK [Azonexus sp.]